HVHYNRCPVCEIEAIKPFASVKDYSVSGETFSIWECADCGLRFTQDAPDEKESARYYKSGDYISHTNTKRGIINQLYLQVRKFTLGLKAAVVEKHTGLTTGRLLDVGAGTGAFLKYMQQKNWQVSGVEPDADARSVARKIVNLELLPTEVLQTFPKHSFDVITLWHVLEHVHQLHEHMDILKSLLKPGGTLFIAVPNYRSLDARIYDTAWAAYDVPRHLYHFSPESIGALMHRHGLRVRSQLPMWFDAFYISLLSSKYKNGDTAWIGAVSSGLRSNMNALLRKDQCSSVLYVVTN
ncbi:MAG TPA: class I SAM-dependent methyltransferase, partial [Niastella sp.]|nr:class I SAM-dependent methyltransferase [Niastella sp.]